MKIKLLSFIFLSSSILFANNYHNQLIIPSVQQENPFWEFAGQPISQKEEGSFAQVITKWNDKLDILCKKLNDKLREDIGASIQQLDFYMENERFIDVYTGYCKQMYKEILDSQEEIDHKSSNFTQLKLYYLQCSKTVKIYSSDTIAGLSHAFGTDKKMHYIILNKYLYNKKIIDSLYEATAKNELLFYVMPHTNLHKSRIIEYANYLHLGITLALSDIIHQGDYFTKLLSFFTYNTKSASVKTQNYGAEIVLFRSYLESCFQSKNPHEIALFLEPYLDSFNQEFVLLWREFMDDIKNCYDIDDLEAYATLSLKKRREILYTTHNK